MNAGHVASMHQAVCMMGTHKGQLCQTPERVLTGGEIMVGLLVGLAFAWLISRLVTGSWKL